MPKNTPKKKAKAFRSWLKIIKLITVDRRKIEPDQLSPKVRKLRGIIKINEDIDYKKILTEEFSKKYRI